VLIALLIERAGRTTPILASPEALALPVVISLVWLWFLSAHRSRDMRVLGTGPTEYRRVLSATGLCFGILAVVLVASGLDVSRSYFLVALPAGALALTVDRWIWRQWLTRQRLVGHYLLRALVVGGRSDVEYVIRQIDKAGASYHVVGAVLDGTDPGRLGLGNNLVAPIVGMDAAAAAAVDLGADVVIVAGNPGGDSDDFIRDLAWALESTSAELVVASRLTDVAGPRIHFRPVEGLPLMHVELPQFDGVKHQLKRLFDIVVAAVALLVLAPFVVVLALIIAVESPGSGLFRQTRVGRDGRTFTLLKLRTMSSTASATAGVDPLESEPNDGAGLLFKLRVDPRVTRIGRVLRKYSIDEVPQLWNVLVGDMSLVGPRPPLPREVAAYDGSIKRRLYIKPGLTGMWQVNGRSNLSWEESIRLDLYYVENWSLMGDLVILWRTVKEVVSPTGAY
jgi:exopolysaccharide biosynthesis polyprenyl glycosylphosphotransferase